MTRLLRLKALGEQELERRASLRSLAAAIAAAPLGRKCTAEQFFALGVPASGTSAALLDAWEAMLVECGQAYYGPEMDSVKALVTVLVDQTVARLHDPLSPNQRRRLARLAAEAALLDGWLAFTDDRAGGARGSFALARDALLDDLHACALASTSSLHSTTLRGGQAPSPVARRLLEEASLRLPKSSPRIAHAWIHARLAEELAAAGERAAYRRSIDVAENAWNDAAEGQDGFFSRRGFFVNWSTERLDAYRGLCLLLLGRDREAERSLSAAATGPTIVGRTRATVLADLAAARAGEGEPQEACAVALEAADIALRSGYRMGVHRLTNVRRRLRAWSELPEVAGLEERLAAA